MTDKTEFLQAIDDAILDAESLERFINGSDSETVLTRLSAEYPTLQKAIKQMFENGGLPATPFKTKALMEASELVDGDYAQVTDDTDNNGLYVKTAGTWVKSAYDPVALANAYTDAELDKAMDLINPTEDLLQGVTLLENTGVSGKAGNEFASELYQATPFIAVNYHDYIDFKGRTTGEVGIAAYDKDQRFYKSIHNPVVDGYLVDGGMEFIIDDPNIAYIRASNRYSYNITMRMTRRSSIVSILSEFGEYAGLISNNADNISSNTARIEVLEDSSDEIISVKDLLDGVTVYQGKGINAKNGAEFDTELYEATDYISVSVGDIIHYKGHVSSITGIAGYDANKQFTSPLYYYERDGAVNDGVYFTITDPDVMFMRASNKISTGAVMSITAEKKYDANFFDSIPSKQYVDSKLNDVNAPDIRITFNDPAFFWVYSKTPDGSYVSHLWRYNDRPAQQEQGWWTSESRHNGARILAGNYNFIYIMNDGGAVSDNTFVGIGHGCETMLYAQFFLDGKEFDPTTAQGEITGKEFKVRSLSDIYRPDRDASFQAAIDAVGSANSDYAVPSQPLEVRSRRYAEMTIKGNNKITRYQKLTILKDNVQFKVLYGAMQRTYQPIINGTITLNDKDGTVNYFPTSHGDPQPKPPSTVKLVDGVAYGDKNCFATKFEANGVYNGYAYNLTTTGYNLDSTQRKKNHIQMSLSMATSNKVYFVPVVTSDLNAAYPDFEIDVFYSGDYIEVYSESEINVSRV